VLNWGNWLCWTQATVYVVLFFVFRFFLYCLAYFAMLFVQGSVLFCLYCDILYTMQFVLWHTVYNAVCIVTYCVQCSLYCDILCTVQFVLWHTVYNAVFPSCVAHYCDSQMLISRILHVTPMLQIVIKL
jgi:hypothetical protein